MNKINDLIVLKAELDLRIKLYRYIKKQGTNIVFKNDVFHCKIAESSPIKDLVLVTFDVSLEYCIDDTVLTEIAIVIYIEDRPHVINHTFHGNPFWHSPIWEKDIIESIFDFLTFSTQEQILKYMLNNKNED